MSFLIKPYCAILICGSIVISCFTANAQNVTSTTNILGQNIAQNVNVVTSAVPFLLIAPDARAGGMGDAGAASSPDVYSTHWNPAKLAFIKDSLGVSVSYIPWLRQVVPDINFAYLSWFYKLHNHQTIGGSLRYFSLENTAFTGNNTVTTGNFNPNEYALDLTYSRQLSSHWSVGLSARYIYSNLSGASLIQGTYTQPGKTLGVDISTFYQSREIGATRSTFTFGACISNIGPKIRYSATGLADCIPTNLRLGGGYTLHLDRMNKLSFLLDLNKLLVPTPPVYSLNVYGAAQPTIIAGKNPNVPVAQGIFQSFYDAPGGFIEEIHEVTCSPGIEYTYDEQFSYRAGAFYESITKGGRKYFTLGTGFRLKILSIDVSYIIPVSQQNPLQNTLVISLAFYLR
jgi:hypothetical protein